MNLMFFSTESCMHKKFLIEEVRFFRQSMSFAENFR